MLTLSKHFSQEKLISYGINTLMTAKMRALFLLFLLLFSCSPASLIDVQVEGEAQTKKLVRELEKIDTKEDLQKALPQIKKRFNELADVLILARDFSSQNPEPSLASEQLFVALARLYEMPGGRELIESAQFEAVEKLKR